MTPRATKTNLQKEAPTGLPPSGGDVVEGTEPDSSWAEEPALDADDELEYVDLTAELVGATEAKQEQPEEKPLPVILGGRRYLAHCPTDGVYTTWLQIRNDESGLTNKELAPMVELFIRGSFMPEAADELVLRTMRQTHLGPVLQLTHWIQKYIPYLLDKFAPVMNRRLRAFGLGESATERVDREMQERRAQVGSSQKNVSRSGPRNR